MHELFLKMMTGGRVCGKDTVSVNARFPNLIKSYRSILIFCVNIASPKEKKKSQIIPSLALTLRNRRKLQKFLL